MDDSSLAGKTSKPHAATPGRAKGVWIRAAVPVFCLLVAIAFAWYLVQPPIPSLFGTGVANREEPNKPEDRKNQTTTQRETPASGDPTPADLSPSDVDSGQTNADSVNSPAESRNPDWTNLLEDVESAIVQIESGEIGHRQLGSGFLVANKQGQRLVATNYHVVKSTLSAQVRFPSGVAYLVKGYAAVQPDYDLALLALDDFKADNSAIPVATGEPKQLQEVIAIGHPEGLAFSPSDGRVSKLVETDALPKDLQSFVAKHTDSVVNQRWIQHTAVTSPGSSGGPLLNQQGEVVGINTWTDRRTKFSYAIPAYYLRALLENPLGETAPLARYARLDLKRNALIDELSADSLAELSKRAEAISFAPTTAEQYSELQDYAFALTVATLPSRFGVTQQNRVAELRTAAEKEIGSLKARKWDAVAAVTLLNDQAISQLDHPLSGVVAYGRVEKTFHGDRGERAQLITLAGSEEPLLVPTDNQLLIPEAGSYAIVIGILNGQVIRYGENPLKPISAKVLVPAVVIPWEGS